MTLLTQRGDTAAVRSQVAWTWESGYAAVGGGRRFGAMIQKTDISDTQSVSTLLPPEGDLSPYEWMRASGALAFWDEPEEDIYSLDDGEPV